MKRCPHCRQEDHEDAILCKACFRRFDDPVAKRAPPRAAVTPRTVRRRTGAAGAVVRLIILLAALAWFSRGEMGDSVRDALANLIAVVAPAGVPATPAGNAATPVESSGAPAAPSAPPPEEVRRDAPAGARTPPAPPNDAATSRVRGTSSVRPAGSVASAAEERAATADRGAPETAAPAPAAGEPPTEAQPVRAGGAIQAPRKIKHVNPAYPPTAKAARVQGVVIIEATIDPSGRVSSARVLRSIPLLDAEALAAVNQWEYEPTLRDGVAVPVIATVTVRFSLQ